MKVEEWKPAPGLDAYEVSNLGRVRHSRHKRIRICPINADGFRYVYFYVKSEKKNNCASVGRLVCHAFNGHPPPRGEVRYLNGDRTDNVAENLVWQDDSERRKRRVLPRGEAHRNALLTEALVKEIRSMGGHYTVIADALDLNPSTVWDVIHYRSWRHIQ